MIAVWWPQGAFRRWWLIAGAFALAHRIFTLSYFIPTMIKLTGAESLPESDAAAIASQRRNLNHIRHALVSSAWPAALKAFSLLYEHRG